jgi:N4-gp56 family major capsid protein
MSVNLNSTADINAVVNWVQTQGAGTVAPEVFYTKQLLDTIRLDAAQYAYYRYAEEMPIQEKADKLVVRRWAPLRAHIVPLAEGVPPMSDKGSVEKYELEADQYGRYMEFTDKVDFKVVDPVIAHYSKEYSIVAIETLDLLAQHTMLTVSQKFFAGAAANYSALRPWSKPSIADLRLIGLSLKKQLVKPRSNGKFHVLVSPEFTYDMLDDEYVQNYMKINQTTAHMYDDEVLVPLFGFEFHEVMNCPTTCAYKKADGKYYMTVFKYIEEGDTAQGEKATSPDGKTVIDYNEVEIPAESAAIAAGYETDKRTGQAASYIPAHTDYDAAARTMYAAAQEQDADIHLLQMQHTLVIGKDALVKTGIAGEGNAKMYVKPLGSTGVLDPIDQRQSIGFKINNVGFGSTRTEAIVDYINVPTQL